jgi:hypothetical protein
VLLVEIYREVVKDVVVVVYYSESLRPRAISILLLSRLYTPSGYISTSFIKRNTTTGLLDDNTPISSNFKLGRNSEMSFLEVLG